MRPGEERRWLRLGIDDDDVVAEVPCPAAHQRQEERRLAGAGRSGEEDSLTAEAAGGGVEAYEPAPSDRTPERVLEQVLDVSRIGAASAGEVRAAMLRDDDRGREVGLAEEDDVPAVQLEDIGRDVPVDHSPLANVRLGTRGDRAGELRCADRAHRPRGLAWSAPLERFSAPSDLEDRSDRVPLGSVVRLEPDGVAEGADREPIDGLPPERQERRRLDDLARRSVARDRLRHCGRGGEGAKRAGNGRTWPRSSPGGAKSGKNSSASGGRPMAARRSISLGRSSGRERNVTFAWPFP